MIVSLRSPKPVRSPNAPAYGEFGSTQLPLSEPVSKVFGGEVAFSQIPSI